MMTRDDRTAPSPARFAGRVQDQEDQPSSPGQLPDAPMAMPVQQLERPGGLFAALVAWIAAPIGRTQRGL